MKIRYKGILCNLSTYRVMGKDRPAPVIENEFTAKMCKIENMNTRKSVMI